MKDKQGGQEQQQQAWFWNDKTVDCESRATTSSAMKPEDSARAQQQDYFPTLLCWVTTMIQTLRNDPRTRSQTSELTGKELRSTWMADSLWNGRNVRGLRWECEQTHDGPRWWTGRKADSPADASSWSEEEVTRRAPRLHSKIAKIVDSGKRQCWKDQSSIELWYTWHSMQKLLVPHTFRDKYETH